MLVVCSLVGIQVAMPSRMRRDLEETIHWLVNKEGPRLLVEAEGWTKAYWARTRYLLTWPVYGNSSRSVYATHLKLRLFNLLSILSLSLFFFFSCTSFVRHDTLDLYASSADISFRIESINICGGVAVCLQERRWCSGGTKASPGTAAK